MTVTNWFLLFYLVIVVSLLLYNLWHSYRDLHIYRFAIFFVLGDAFLTHAFAIGLTVPVLVGAAILVAALLVDLSGKKSVSEELESETKSS